MKRQTMRILLGAISSIIFVGLAVAIDNTTQAQTTPQPTQSVTRSATGLRIQPISGRVTVKLINQTYAPITYQAIGDTAPRILAGRSEVMLQGLSAPKTITFQRQDFGLIQATPRLSSTTPGQLEVTLSETTDLSQGKLALRIESNGDVSAN